MRVMAHAHILTYKNWILIAKVFADPPTYFNFSWTSPQHIFVSFCPLRILNGKAPSKKTTCNPSFPEQKTPWQEQFIFNACIFSFNSPEHGWWNFRSCMSYIKTGRNLHSCKQKYILLNEKFVSKTITPLKWLKNYIFWGPRPRDKMCWFGGRASKTRHFESLLLVDFSG